MDPPTQITQYGLCHPSMVQKGDGLWEESDTIHDTISQSDVILRDRNMTKNNNKKQQQKTTTKTTTTTKTKTIKQQQKTQKQTKQNKQKSAST